MLHRWWFVKESQFRKDRGVFLLVIVAMVTGAGLYDLGVAQLADEPNNWLRVRDIIGYFPWYIWTFIAMFIGMFSLFEGGYRATRDRDKNIASLQKGDNQELTDRLANLEALVLRQMAATDLAAERLPGLLVSRAHISVGGSFIGQSENVASVTDEGVGQRSINWNQDYADADYHVSITPTAGRFEIGRKSVGGISIRTFHYGGQPQDIELDVLAIGDGPPAPSGLSEQLVRGMYTGDGADTQAIIVARPMGAVRLVDWLVRGTDNRQRVDTGLEPHPQGFTVFGAANIYGRVYSYVLFYD